MKEIFDPLFGDIKEIKSAIISDEKGNILYIHGDERFLLQKDILITLSILLNNFARRFSEKPRFLIYTMEKHNVSIFFIEKISFILLFSEIEVGFLKLQIEELKDKINFYMPSIIDEMENIKQEINLSLPDESKIADLIKNFSYIEG